MEDQAKTTATASTAAEQYARSISQQNHRKADCPLSHSYATTIASSGEHHNAITILGVRS